MMAGDLTPFQRDMALIHLGPDVSPEDTRRFLELAGFQTKDSAREEALKAAQAFKALGWEYRTTIGGNVILASYAGYGAEQFPGGWVPDREVGPRY